MSRFRFWIDAATCALFVLPALPAYAEPEAVAVAAPAPVVTPALWKVADKDTTIWLFGTIHVLPGQVDWYRGPIAAAFDASQELVTEVRMDETAQSQDVILRMSRRDDGKTLRETLAPAEQQAYDTALSGLGLPTTAFDANDAWFAALMLTLIPLKTAGYSTETGIDQQVATRAKARHLTNEAFETVEYQIGLFDKLPEPTQRAYLGEVLEALPSVKADVDAMVAAWKTGDAEHLAELLNEDESDPLVRKVLITDRNVTWAKWLKARLKKPGTVFVAVGAGHLAGPGSVQDQLAASGIRSQRVQ
ncbi:TraB/GumN family protein [Novosphingobium kaempferiae]|uniref:TraB/GumN family protein n=1 Tax=Novosphingobium kaempferiae TaxID=2896849 RepID=UPI001E2A8314|nr:TraB/GumN family protein [Novosphingobium kaempferiae]